MNETLLEQLARDCPTPMYLFDMGKLKKRIRYLRQNLPRSVDLCYAIKANTFILREMEGWVDRFEVCSPGEGAICEELGLPEEKLVISGVYKTPEYIEHLVRDCPHLGRYTVESMEQFYLLVHLALKYDRKLPVLLRLTSGNQFGLDAEEVRTILSRPTDMLDIRGIQYFSGTQKHSLKRLQRELRTLDSFLQALEQDCGFHAEELEFGPGLRVCYFQDEEYDEDQFLADFSSLLENMEFKTHITLELGRSIAASCGTYLSRVVDTKRNGGQNYAILDGGIHHLVYYGQSMAMRVPHYRTFPAREGEPEVWNLFGSLCTINDILVKQLPVPGLAIGDLFAFENTGAYCMTEGISLFLSRDLPRVSLLTEDGKLISVRDSLPTSTLNTPNY